MEKNKQSSLLKSTMNYGAMLGLALIIYSLLLWMMDATTNKYLGYVSSLITIAGIVLATRAFRDQEQGGFITYGRALAVGTLTSVFAGIITGFFTYLLYTVIDPGLIDKTYAIMEQTYYEAGMSDDQTEVAMNMAKRFTNPLMMSLLGLLGSAFMGFIFSLITSIFLKKEADPFETDSV
ncbi:MAG: DUF4199 domain-containing protein [Bacteroidales bacterium]